MAGLCEGGNGPQGSLKARGGNRWLAPQPEAYCAYHSCSVNDICRRTVALLYEYSTLHRELNPGYDTDDNDM
ncbi:hypothetical protein ANN_20934 [Periplaneta americana]|uniref:Uncharacterized protein n=1 Tax=Periplaneta americana TaxID=6978 RepID=A0ABQ8SF40_PERAM|nr:hypothetical protein ANN_20934 [Periplaneta americana]